MLVGLALIDAPAIVAVAVAGVHYGFVDTYAAVSEWRLEHPASFAPSAILAVVVVTRWRRSSV